MLGLGVCGYGPGLQEREPSVIPTLPEGPETLTLASSAQRPTIVRRWGLAVSRSTEVPPARSG